MNFIAYPIKVFATEKTLAVDIFLSLPKNKKHLKLCSAGDKIDLEFIEKLIAKGVTQLFVQSELSADPDALKIFIEDPTTVSIETVLVESVAPTPALQAPELPDTLVTAESPNTGEASETPSPTLDQNSESTSFSALPEDAPQELRFSQDSIDTQEASFSPDQNPMEEELTIDSEMDKKEEEEALRFSKGDPKAEAETFILKSSKEPGPENDKIFHSENEVAKAEKALEFNIEGENFEDEESENQVQKISRVSANKTSMAPNLAPQIAFGLGYTNIDFLTEIALAATLHFREEDGSFTALPSEISKLRQSMQEEQESRFKHDAQDVISFLETYLSDPDCTQLKGEIVPICLERTLQKLQESQKLHDIWNLGLWSSTLSTTLSMDSYSTCSKAAAKASKIIRDADSAI